MTEKSTMYGWIIKIVVVLVFCLLYWMIRTIYSRHPDIAKSTKYIFFEKYIIKPVFFLFLIITVITFVIL